MIKAKSSLINKFISWLMIVILAITGLITIKNADAVGVPGDGFEYLMMQISFQNHLSFDVTEEDIEDAKAYFDNQIFDTIYRDRADTTLVEGNNGKLYAKHYGLYSVLCLPLSRVFHFLGVNPAKAFMVMNLVFWITALVVIMLCLKTENWRKTLIIALLVFNPAYFYLSWVHTEVFIFAFVVMALVFWNNRNHWLAMLLASTAATCNLGVLALALVIGLDFVISKYFEIKSISAIVKKTIPVVLCAIPGFIPVILSYIHFGTYSAVAAVASVSSSDYPVDSRLWAALSYIFDPNQGMIIYSGLVVPAFFVIVVTSYIRRDNILKTTLNVIAVLLMLVIVSQELHINCGMAFIMRYNVWMLPLYIFFVMMNTKNIFSSLTVAGLSSLWSFGIIMIMITSGLTNCYLDFTPIGDAVNNAFPALYNPPAGIFYSRTLGTETYYSESPVALRDDDGNVHKILLTQAAQESIDNGEWLLINGDDASLSNVCGRDYTYLNYSNNGVRLVPVTDRIDFSDMSDTDSSYILSSVGTEGNNLLVYGNELHIRNYMLPGNYEGELGLANVFGGTQLVLVTVNGELVYSGPVSMDDAGLVFDFFVDENCVCDMTINIPGALSPSSVDPDSSDDRVLSLYLTEFSYKTD